MAANSSSKMILYIWPGSWNLPSIDPSCIAAVLYLQYTIPGKFTIVESGNPDVAPTGEYLLNIQVYFLFTSEFKTGHLPFLTHEEQIIPTFALIAKYVTGLKDVCVTNIGSSLNNTENSQKIAWCAHVESNMGDLVVNIIHTQHVSWRCSLRFEVSYSILSSRQLDRSDAVSTSIFITCSTMLLCSWAHTRISQAASGGRRVVEPFGSWKARKEALPRCVETTERKDRHTYNSEGVWTGKGLQITVCYDPTYYLVPGHRESSGFNGYLCAPSWPKAFFLLG